MSEHAVHQSAKTDDADALAAIRRGALRLGVADTDYTPLINFIGDARFALLGEASHGTQEFYRERAAITTRLIAEKHYVAVAVEADWPDAYRVNRYVRGLSDDPDADAALSGFKRFPAWMWRNEAVRDANILSAPLVERRVHQHDVK